MRKSHTSRAVRHMRVPLLLLMEGFTESVKTAGSPCTYGRAWYRGLTMKACDQGSCCLRRPRRQVPRAVLRVSGWRWWKSLLKPSFLVELVLLG